MARQRLGWFAVSFSVLLIPVVVTGVVFWRASRARDEASRAVESSSTFSYHEKAFDTVSGSGVESITAKPIFRDITLFRDSILVSAAAGLYAYDRGGTFVRSWRVGLELPPYEPGQMSAGQDVFLGTRGGGLLRFDGNRIFEILPDDPALRNVTTVLTLASGGVLFGTERGGAVLFDGHRMAPLSDALRTEHVTALSGGDGDLWIGTLQHGVFHYHGGQTDHFLDKLPDPQVLAIATQGNHAYIGTPLGVVEFRENQNARRLAEGFFARAISAASSLTVGTEDEGIVELPLTDPRPPIGRLAGTAVAGAVTNIREFGGARYAVTPGAVYRFDAGRGWVEAVAAPAGALTTRNVAALGFGDPGIWVGYFNAGLDILTSDFSLTRHYEDDTFFV